jgi:hypothetical protein
MLQILPPCNGTFITQYASKDERKLGQPSRALSKAGAMPNANMDISNGRSRGRVAVEMALLYH